MPTVNLIIKGKVQGVYYRIAAKEEADRLCITGWVKYISEGKIEVMATGTESNLKQLEEWCNKGPEKATVTGVIVTPLSEESFDEFTIVLEEYPHDV